MPAARCAETRALSRKQLLLVLLLALLPRLTWVGYRSLSADVRFEYPDEALHWQLAENLVQRGALVSDDGRYAARMPVYPLALAPFAALSGRGEDGPALARLAQAVLGACTVAIAAAWAGAAGGRRAGWLVGLASAFDPFAVFFSSLLLTEVLFTFLAVAAAAMVWRQHAGADPPAAASTLLIALLLTAAVMTRPSAAGWVLALAAIAILAPGRSADRARRAAMLVVVAAVGFLPWGLRNYALLGEPAWLSTNGGVTLYDAQGPQADGSSNQAFLTDLRQRPELAELNEAEFDAALRSLAIQQMRRDPQRVFSLAAAKFRRTWSLTPNVAEYRSGAAAIAGAAYTALVLAAALGGLLALLFSPARRHMRGLPMLLGVTWLAAAYFTFVHCFYVGSVRYRVPLMPMLCVAATPLLAGRPRDAERDSGAVTGERPSAS